jgi:hypothetical protein
VVDLALKHRQVDQIVSVSSSIAYLVLTHEDPAQLRRLMKRLESDGATFYVHVDGKVNIEAFRRATADIKQVHFCEPRSKVMWAAFSVVEATLCLLKTALAHERESCNRFVLLSGTDYPIASNKAISRFFVQHPKREFVRGFAIREAGKSQLWRVRGRHFRELAPRFSWLRAPLFAIERGLRLFPRPLPSDIAFACGSQWWALTRGCAQFCIDFARLNPDFVKLFKLMFAPDEIFFHTIVHNSPYAAEVTKGGNFGLDANLHYLPGAWIRTLDDARTALNAHPPKLFARKFASDQSALAMDFIDRYLDSTPAKLKA